MSGTAAFLPQIADLTHREALRIIHDRLTAAERVNPSIVTPTALTSDFNSNQQRIQNLKNPQAAADLVNLQYTRDYVQAMNVVLKNKLAGLFIDAAIGSDTAKPR